MVHVKHVEEGLAKYLDKELITKLPDDGIQRLVAGTAISILIKRLSNIVSELKDNKVIQLLDIIDEDCNIDIEVLRDEIKENIPSGGLHIDLPMIGMMTLHKADVDDIYEHIRYSKDHGGR